MQPHFLAPTGRHKCERGVYHREFCGLDRPFRACEALPVLNPGLAAQAILFRPFGANNTPLRNPRTLKTLAPWNPAPQPGGSDEALPRSAGSWFPAFSITARAHPQNRRRRTYRSPRNSQEAANEEVIRKAPGAQLGLGIIQPVEIHQRYSVVMPALVSPGRNIERVYVACLRVVEQPKKKLLCSRRVPKVHIEVARTGNNNSESRGNSARPVSILALASSSLWKEQGRRRQAARIDLAPTVDS